MPASFPNEIFEPREIENVSGVDFDPARKNRFYADDLNNTNSEIVAIEETLGENPEGDYETVKARLDAMSGPQLLASLHDIDGLLSADYVLFTVPVGFRLQIVGIAFRGRSTAAIIASSQLQMKNSLTNNNMNNLFSNAGVPLVSGSADRYFSQFLSEGNQFDSDEVVEDGNDLVAAVAAGVGGTHPDAEFFLDIDLIGYLLPM